MMDLVRDWVLDPLGLVLLWLGLLWWLAGRVRRGRLALAALGVAGLMAVSAPAIVNPVVAAHERAVAPGQCAVDLPIVVLGGGVDTRATDVDAPEAMTPATFARLNVGIRLSVQADGVGAEAPLVLVGGASGRLAEADVMAAHARSVGVPAERLVLERRSTSTAGNAREVALLLGDGAALRLVTSALHLPRAMASFEAVGLVPCAVPIDRIAIEDVPAWALWPQTTALIKFDRWLHERIALALYRWRGDA